MQNTGAAFGILNAVDFPYKAAVIALVATVALVGIAVFAAGLSPHQRLARVRAGADPGRRGRKPRSTA